MTENTMVNEVTATTEKTDKRKKIYPDVQCPLCGKTVNSRAGALALHKRSCKAKSVPENAPLVTSKDKPKIEPKTKEIKETLERALAQQAEMLKAPEAFTATVSHDENWQLRVAYAPETIPRYDKRGNELKATEGGHTHTAYIGDARTITKDIAKGYVPVLNEHGEYVTNQGGDILYTRRREITERIISAAQMESRSRLRQVTKLASQKATATDVPMAEEGEVKEQEYGEIGKITLKPGDI